jgi:adenosylcobyric acid synthase
MTAICVMVLGTSSGAGKSWLVTALCRYYARQGLRVAPFKAQNMSNNARVVPGGEIGSAQYFQALAARAQPDVRMNPLLLKPESDTHSQVVLMGQVDAALGAMPWRDRAPVVWPHIAQALDSLRAENDLVVIEGAGSPTEINLMDCDIVNLRVARHAQARCLLVTDIDRGGAFAHLYGTWALLPPEDRERLAGYVLNKFRGDPALLAPAPQQLHAMTGVPVLATLPMVLGHGLPQEDGLPDPNALQSLRQPGQTGAAFSDWKATGEQEAQRLRVAVLTYPRISNHDEFQPLCHLPGVQLIWARHVSDCEGADLLILPGSKHTSSDLAWLRRQGLDACIAQHAARGQPVLGICGGLQMLGEALIDPHGIDGNAPGLGLLPLVTVFEVDKTVVRGTHAFGELGGPWSALSGQLIQGYEIHHGQTRLHTGMLQAGVTAQTVLPHALGWQSQQGAVLGCYVHGLFENPGVIRALFGVDQTPLEESFDRLADCITAHMPASGLQALIQP